MHSQEDKGVQIFGLDEYLSLAQSMLLNKKSPRDVSVC